MRDNLDHSERSVAFRVEEDGSHEFRPHPPSPPPPSNSSPILSHKRTESPPPPSSPVARSPPPSPGRRSDNSPKFSSTKLRSNLTREQVDRDPLFFYEVVKTLGVGSMGSVARVRKRTNVIGGSARKDIQDAVRRQKRDKTCLKIPLIGGLFRFCIDGEMKHSNSSNALSAISEHSGYNFSQNGSIPKLPSLGYSEDLVTSSSRSGKSAGSTSTRQHSHEILYAMKSIHLSRVTDNAFVTELKNEISILKELDHPHIVRAIETFEHRNQIFIIMELCSGGDLYSRDPYKEEEAARIVSSILSAIAYMHSKNISHRDLKYENILFVNDSPTAEVKLIDFGLSKVYGDNLELTEGVGTIYTMAPEVLKGNYTHKADVWSVGVIAYMLLSSQMPFYGRKRRHIVEQILNCQFDFRGRRWKRISDQAKAFVEDLLVLDPEDRLDAQDALASSWLNKRFAATSRAPHIEEESMARDAMLRYSGYTKLKKMALMVVAHKSSSEEIGILRKLFQKYDTRRDGSISYDEFCEAMSEFGHSEEDLRNMFEAVDLDGTGRIRYTEFLAATIEAQGAISEERLAEAFDRLDTDDSGYISAENLAEILGKDFPREEIDEIIQEAGVTKDNLISYSDFLALWENKNEQNRDAQLKMLEGTIQTKPADIIMLSTRGSSLMDDDVVEETKAAEGRASFLVEKHNPDKHVGFTDTVVSIGENDEVKQEIIAD